jgi:hypothetical protein
VLTVWVVHGGVDKRQRSAAWANRISHQVNRTSALLVDQDNIDREDMALLADLRADLQRLPASKKVSFDWDRLVARLSKRGRRRGFGKRF